MIKQHGKTYGKHMEKHLEKTNYIHTPAQGPPSF